MPTFSACKNRMFNTFCWQSFFFLFIKKKIPAFLPNYGNAAVEEVSGKRSGYQAAFRTAELCLFCLESWCMHQDAE